MFVIKNVSHTHDVVLQDLRIVLGRQDEIDLDKACHRFVADQSSDLRNAINQGLIHVLRKTDPNGNDQKVSQDGAILKAIEEMEKRITEKVAEKMAAKPDAQPAPNVEALTAALQSLQDLLKNGVPAAKPEGETSVEVVDDTVIDIHARTLDRLSKKTEGSVKHEETTTKSDALGNLDELEGML
jgi:hypothetical protein